MRSIWFHISSLLPASAAIDDSTILLSVSRSEMGAGAGQRLADAVSEHNVTQLASFIEEMAEVDLQGDGVTSEIKTALELIRNNVLNQIVGGLKSEHSADQILVDGLNSCVTGCNSQLEEAQQADRAFAANTIQAMIDHIQCRGEVKNKYVDKITKCEELDAWIAGLRWPGGVEQECVWGNPDDIVGRTFQDAIEWYTSRWEQWEIKHKACVEAVKEYVEVDADCDHKQMLFEVSSCSEKASMQNNCQGDHKTCCQECAETFHKTVNEVECREKDRKIDYSAVQKIECYLDILMASPSDQEIKDLCTKDQCTASDWRLQQYSTCHFQCEEVDYDSQAGYSEIDGVNTTHRHEDEAQEKRCTREFDVNFPAMLLCNGCLDPGEGPCSEAFTREHYWGFQRTVQTPNIDEGTKFCPCSGLHDIPIPFGAPYEEGHCPTTHEEWYSYSLAKCRDCPAGPDPNIVGDCDFFGDEITIMVTEQVLNIGEVIVKGPKGVVPLTAQMSSNRQSKFHYAERCVDGDLETSCMANGLSSVKWLSVRMPEPQCISSVEVHNIKTCKPCQDRIVGAHVSLVDRGMLVWRSTFDHKQDAYMWHMSDIDHTLIAEFPLDSNCNSPHGGYQGFAPNGLAFAPGVKGNALSLEKAQYCMVEELKSFKWGHGFSACAWTKRTDPSGYMGIIGNGYYTDGSWEIRVGREGCDSGTCTMLGGGVVSTLEDPKSTWDVQGLQLPMNQWQHVCMTYNGHQLKFYVNKELQATGSRDFGSIEPKDIPFYIGTASPDREPFHGLIDQVRLYKRTLTPSDVALVYELDTAGVEED